MVRFIALFLVVSFAALAPADGPADNVPASARRLPKLGIEVPDERRAELEKQLAEFDREIKEISAVHKRTDAKTRALLPDVQVYYKAVNDALRYQEFHDPKELDIAMELLKEGRARAAALAEGKAPWTEQTGLVVRAYVSKIDGSIQPFGLVIPDSYSGKGPRVRLDFWFHGRGETLTELNFIQQRRKFVGQFAPADTIVLHPYGRWNNANKFAGEVDAFEALDAVKKHYRIDDERISVRGFSMGGGAAWHFAVHHSDQWFAANPGAGFSETPDFLRVFQKEELKPQWWEQKLWRLYDCTEYAANLANLPTIAYSGEKDAQKQAADIMARALEKEGVTLTHIIGAGAGHQYTKEAAAEVERRMDSLALAGRERAPWKVRFQTYTLKYNRMHWVRVDGLRTHWEQARVDAIMPGEETPIKLTVQNVTDLTLSFDAGEWNWLSPDPVEVQIVDGESKTTIAGPRLTSDRSWQAQFYKDGAKWKLGPRPPQEGVVRKRRDLQGPIDDAFMDSFIFVRPTGKARSEMVDKWSRAELDRAIEQWRRHFRGDARVKDDTAITDADVASANLILWGDPESNAVMKKIADKLPIEWGEKVIPLGEPSFDSKSHALISISPNPLNPNRYVVLNSGFTFREYSHLNNARQVPMLPDWAVIDLSTPPNAVWPGKVVNAGFFDEQWRLRPLKR